MFCQTKAQFVFQHFQPLLAVTSNDIPLIGEKIPVPRFSEHTLKMLCHEFCSIQRGSPLIVDVPDVEFCDMIVVGDLAGSLHNLLALFTIFGLPPFKRYAFLGDFIAAGDSEDQEFSLEVFILLMSMKCLFPSHIILIQGSNESSEKQNKAHQKDHSLKQEVLQSYSMELWKTFAQAFTYLNIGMLSDINGYYFGNARSFQTFSYIAKKLNDLEEVQTKCFLPIPSQEMIFRKMEKMNRDIYIDDEIFSKYHFEKLFLSGCSADNERDNNNDIMIFISTSGANKEITFMNLKMEQIETMEIVSPPIIHRNNSIFTQELTEVKPVKRVSAIHGIIRPRIKASKGFLNLNEILGSINIQRSCL